MRTTTEQGRYPVLIGVLHRLTGVHPTRCRFSPHQSEDFYRGLLLLLKRRKQQLEHDITDILVAAASGDSDAENKLFNRVASELKAHAKRELFSRNSSNRVQPTALVGGVYLKLFGNKTPAFNNRRHFYGAAIRAMRELMMDAAKKNSVRGLELPLPTDLVAAPGINVELLDIGIALESLDKIDPRAAEVLRMRFYLGLSFDEITEAIGVSQATAERDLQFARTWIRSKLVQDFDQ